MNHFLAFNKKHLVVSSAGICGLLLLSLAYFFFLPRADASSAALVPSTFVYSFNVPGQLFASEYEQNSTSPYWWVSSGGRLVIPGGLGETIQGRLPDGDRSQVDYAAVNPLDTDNGHYPQNTFRLVTRSKWENSEQSVSLRITNQNLTDTPNRDGYSGILLFNRHIDKDNLYYAGIRDDGLAVIKKKIGGQYYTLTYTQVFGDFTKYNKWTNPSFLPFNQWFGLKTRVTTNANGSVYIQLFLDRNNDGNWKQILTATDSGTGGKPFTGAGSGGIRSDYMDLQFKDFKEQAF